MMKNTMMVMEKMKMNLFLDDVRPCPFVGNWITVTNYDEAIKALNEHDFEFAHLDHDLTVAQTIGQPDDEKTGYDVVMYMKEHNKFPLTDCYVHSLNPVGAERMCRVIAEHYGTREWSTHYFSALRFRSL